MKALFIIHCQDPVYGGSRSIGNLIRSLDADVDLIFPLNLTRKISDEQIRKFYGSRVKNVWFLPQPQSLSCTFDYYAPIHHIKAAVKRVLYQFSIGRYRRIYREGQYDFIHLNSLVLYPMLDKRYPMFIHIREIARQHQRFWNRHLQRDLKWAHGAFYINREVHDACPLERTPSLILKNPFDQKNVEKVDEQKAREYFGVTKEQTVFAMIGNISPIKGNCFVIQAFRKAALKDAVLLIVGRDTNNDGYEAQAQAKAEGDESIRFVGELENTDMLYRITDYVVRGDKAPGAGRTVFEGVYSGGGAILVGDKDKDIQALGLSDEMENRLYFYPPHDEEALASLLRAVNGHRFTQRQYFSNVDEYVKQFTQFVIEHTHKA